MPATHESFNQIAPVNEKQIEFGRQIGIDLAGRSLNVARAMIADVIQRDFSGLPDLGSPTERQVSLAKKFDHDISNTTRRVGDAIIADLMLRLNFEAIDCQGLAPDVVVVNKHDKLQRKSVISSISSDGTVYFRGGNGARAWARSLIKCDD